jgi:ribosomal protein L24
MVEKESKVHVSNVVLFEEKAKKATKAKKAPAKKTVAKKPATRGRKKAAEPTEE